MLTGKKDNNIIHALDDVVAVSRSHMMYKIFSGSCAKSLLFSLLLPCFLLGSDGDFIDTEFFEEDAELGLRYKEKYKHAMQEEMRAQKWMIGGVAVEDMVIIAFSTAIVTLGCFITYRGLLRCGSLSQDFYKYLFEPQESTEITPCMKKQQAEYEFRKALAKNASSADVDSNGLPLVCADAAQQFAAQGGSAEIERLTRIFKQVKSHHV